MEGTPRKSNAVAGGTALGLGVCGGLALAAADAVGYLTPETEAVYTLAVIAGWVLLAWSAIAGVVVAVHLVQHRLRHREASWTDGALLLATAGVIALAVATHAPFGAGSASADSAAVEDDSFVGDATQAGPAHARSGCGARCA